MQIEWMTKEAAGVRLGSPERPLSPRRVLELAKTGRIQSQLVRDPETNQMTTRIHAGSVERFIDERRTPNGQSTDIARKTNGRLVEDNRKINGRLVVREVREVREPRASQSLNSQLSVRSALPATLARLWLTLGEAEDYSGLPASILYRMIHAGALPTIDVGIRRGGRWRVRRVDLDGIEGRLLTA
jgi:hypothetical protein